MEGSVPPFLKGF